MDGGVGIEYRHNVFQIGDNEAINYFHSLHLVTFLDVLFLLIVN